MRDFSVLSDVEFEELCADLLQTVMAVPVQRFAKGKDKGKDLIWSGSTGLGIAQCKHYVKSTFSQLLSSAKAELPKVAKNAPSEYLFMTSQSTVESQNKQVFDVFEQWMSSIDNVWNAEKINDLLHAHPAVEARHIKLWLHSGLQLFWATNSALHNRSRALATRVHEDLPRFVGTSALDSAMEVLERGNVCLIAGSPGVGKTMLSHALLAQLVTQGYIPIEISGDVDEGWAALDHSSKQVFLYDDFLGELALSERMPKKEDRRLANFIHEVSKSPNHKLLLTTREYILRDAEQSYPLLQKIEDSHRLVVEMKHYSRLDRGRILYNHIYHSSLPEEYRSQFAEGAWRKIVDHNEYNPRLIEYATSQLALGFDGTYLDAFIGTLENPQRLWKNAFENHLEDLDRIILQVLCTWGTMSRSFLEEALMPFEAIVGPISSRRIRRSLKTMDQTFLRTSEIGGQVQISFHSPTVREFVLDSLRDDQLALRTVMERIVNIGQLFRLARTNAGHLSYSYTGEKRMRTHAKKLPLGAISGTIRDSILRLLPVQNASSMKVSDKSHRIADLSQVISLDLHNLLSSSWWDQQLCIVESIWNDGIGTPDSVKDILGFAKGTSLLASRENALKAAAVAVLVANQINDDDDWEVVFEIFANILDNDIPYSLIDQFEAYLYDAMGSQGMNMTNIDALLSMAADVDLFDVVEELEEHARKVAEYEQITKSEYGGRLKRSSQDVGGESELQTLFDRFGPS